MLREIAHLFRKEGEKMDTTPTPRFTPDARPTLIGSMPLSDHDAAVDLVLSYIPEIPAWPQLPVYLREGMVAQYAPGMPGLRREGDSLLADAGSESHAEELVAFYEEYLMITEGGAGMDDSRFALDPSDAAGFFALEKRLSSLPDLVAVKGQVTGPFTFATGLKDAGGRAVYYDEQARDAAVKLIAMKARWQVRRLKAAGVPVLIFIDEPALSAFGSSEFISVSREDAAVCLTEVITAVREEGGLAGIHVCANTEWDLVMDAGVDIVNLDAFTYFDRLLLYDASLRRFLDRGGVMALGLVPTLSAEDVAGATVSGLLEMWKDQQSRLADMGFDPEQVRRQTLITPSCGMGARSEDEALRILELTRGLSDAIRAGE